ncbi:MAG TPA: phosphatase PAP2 family protein [Streptosporangiaceae bacterium]|jgi:undecaprenyl-diphosphatase
MPRRGAGSGRARDQAHALLAEFNAVDHAIYQAVAQVPTPELDQAMRRLSRAANHSVLWLSVAAGMAAVGGRPGRRAAARGVSAVGVSSAVVNIGIKALYNRPRPDRGEAGLPVERQVPMPGSRSFPSGHSAAGFAFTMAAGREVPLLALPLGFLAGAVAYSRVHTGVHYPGDAVAGSIIGAAVGQAVAGLASQVSQRGRAAGCGLVTRRARR